MRFNQQPLRGFLRRLTGNADEADDLAQESLAVAWEKRHRFDPDRAFRPWLFGIAWQKYRERRRSWRRSLLQESAYAEMQETVVDGNPGLALDLAAACAMLPPDQRAALLLCLGCDFSHGEAAEALSMPVGTVKSHIARGRKQLAAFLGDEK
jgi:RNA polymerase sigma-70 factor, ECF subfamily